MRKVDIRHYTYAGNLLLTAARVYHGQATNFRTPGSGFARVSGVIACLSPITAVS